MLLVAAELDYMAKVAMVEEEVQMRPCSLMVVRAAAEVREAAAVAAVGNVVNISMQDADVPRVHLFIME
jgi:hypothetical protein